MLKKNTITSFLMVSALSISLTAAAVAADTYKLDPTHTAVVWHINHFGFSNPSGKFMNVDGTVTLDEKNPAASSVNVTIPIATMDSGPRTWVTGAYSGQIAPCRIVSQFLKQENIRVHPHPSLDKVFRVDSSAAEVVLAV